jgi:hypothetical protein
MESPYFPSPVWNSSFEDNDASTTLDTSIETENDSTTRFDLRNGLHDRKMPTSRSSPGAPLGKKMHSMLGYFDDVESFTSKTTQLNPYEDIFSPPGLHLSPKQQTLQQNLFHHNGSAVDVLILGDGEAIKGKGRGQYRGGHSRKNTGCDLEVMQESDESVEGQLSSPVMNVSS